MPNSQHSLIIAVCLWVFVFLTLRSPAQHACSLSKTASKEILALNNYREASSKEDVTYLSARWNINPSVRLISGSVHYAFTVTSDVYDTLQLDLSDSLFVSQVFSKGEAVQFVHANDLLLVSLPGIENGDTLSVQIFYSGTPANSGFGSFVTSLSSDGEPVMWTLSQPFGASDWWPAKESFSDKIDSSDYFISIPPGNKAAGIGKLISVDSSSSVAHIYHWKHRYPIASYLIAVAVANYSEIRREVPLRDGNLELLNYCYPAQLGEWDWQQTEVIAMLQYFDSLFTPYPFMLEKYGHAQFGWGGGMEHQTMSFMADLGPWLTSHELGHQWFGDAVTCASWKDIWLNEGFATYITGLFFERFNPPAFYYWKRNVRDEIMALPGGSVIVDDTASVDRIFDGRLSYAKGAYVLHMLRNTLGDEVFFEGLRTYLETPGLKHGFAQTADFQETMEAASGRNLDTFFEQWVNGEGYPNIEIQWKSTENGLYLNVQQISSLQNALFFSTSLPVYVYGDQDSSAFTLQIDQQETFFLLNPGFRIKSIKIDPNANWLARYNLTLLDNQIPAKDEISVFPNPTKGDIFLKIPEGKLPDKLRLILLDGKSIDISLKVDKSLGIYSLGVDSSLASGVYILQLHYNDVLYSFPVVITH
jgi:aminopeptidase N